MTSKDLMKDTSMLCKSDYERCKAETIRKVLDIMGKEVKRLRKLNYTVGGIAELFELKSKIEALQ